MASRMSSPDVNPETLAMNALGTKAEFMAPLFATSDVGVAILDEKFRFQAINGVLASINGFSVEAHAGKTLRHILGPVAEEVEPRLKRAFGTGANDIFEIRAKLPTRSRVGHWIQTYIPVKSLAGKTVEVCAIVVEVTEKRRLEELLFGLTGKLLYLRANLSRSLDDLCGRADHRKNEAPELARSLELIHQCTADIVDILKMFRPGTLASSNLTIRDIRPAAVSEPPAITKSLRNRPRMQSLSRREHEVIHLLAESRSNKEIGIALGISVRTVEAHRRRIMEKLDLHSLGELVHFAIRNGIVQA